MKCPKCSYLGFETGDRCKNCGYDFSLLSVAEFEPAEYEVHPASIDDVPIHVVNDIVDNALDEGLTFRPATDPPHADAPVVLLNDASPVAPRVPFDSGAMPISDDSALPLFTPEDVEDDEPLIKLPVAPRAPLSVRRTPDTPRLRAVPKSPPRSIPAPVLEFAEDERSPSIPPAEVDSRPSNAAAAPSVRAAGRIVALFVDYMILLGIDAAVVYFTIRMAGLTPDEWRILPVLPMVAFLALLKVAYFYAFTAVGGQTIGKMAAGTCVVTDEGTPLDAARAMRRTSAGALSCALLGLGFLPALFGEHRALHDRLSGTRVVRLRSV